MSIAKRLKDADIYDLGQGVRRAVMSRGKNVKRGGVYVPFLGEAKLVTDHPLVRYGIDGGPMDLGFHNRQTNKYRTWLRLDTGEMIVKDLDWGNEPETTPIVGDGEHSLTWQYGPNAWIKEMVTPEGVKETIGQPAGKPFAMYYELTGFTAEKVDRRYKLTAASGTVLWLDAPYYLDDSGAFAGYVDTTVDNLGDGLYRITYPAPAQDVVIDPTITLGGEEGRDGHKDTYLNSSFSGRNNGGNPLFYTQATYRFGLLDFDISEVPMNAIITSATLSLNVSSAATDSNLHLRRLLTPWVEGSAIDGQDDAASFASPQDNVVDSWAGGGAFSDADYVNTPFVTTTLPASGGNITVDVTEELQYKSDNRATYAGWYLQSDGERIGYDSLESTNIVKRPTLEIEYTLPAVRRGRTSTLSLGTGLHL